MSDIDLKAILRSLKKPEFTFKGSTITVRLNIDARGLSYSQDITVDSDTDTIHLSTTIASVRAFAGDMTSIAAYISDQHDALPMIRIRASTKFITGHVDLPRFGVNDDDLVFAIRHLARHADRIEYALTGERRY